MLDCHVHVVDPDRTVADPTGNPSGAWWELVDASPDAVLDRLSASGIEGGVFVQAVGAHGFDDNSVTLDAAAASDGFAAMATVDPSGTDPVGALEAAVGDGARGLRLFSVPTPDPPWLDSGTARDLVDRCRELDITPAVCCLPEELRLVGDLLGDVVDTEIALDHAGFVEVGGDDDLLVALARHDNLVVKLSTGVFDHAAIEPSVTVDRLIRLVGADRIAWGSDHPHVHDRPYADLVSLAEQATAHLPDAQRAAILEGTTARLWPA